MCHVSHGGMLYWIAMWAFGGSPYNAPLLTWLFLPGQKKWLKNDAFSPFVSFWGLRATWRCGRGGIYGEPPLLGGFPGGMSFR